MRTSIGIIAEDTSDVDVVDAVIEKISHVPYKIERFVGNGCAKSGRNVAFGVQNLRDRGCRYLIVVHDADGTSATALRGQIVAALGASPIAPFIVIIPVQEIEAWLLADHEAIRRALRLPLTVNQVANPEAILRPKEKLRDLIFLKSKSKIRYINSIHNKKIAKECSINKLKRCNSFIPLSSFLMQHLR